MYHDIAYFNAERNPNLSKELILDEKHKADEKMLAALANYEPNSLMDRFHKFLIEKAIGLKLYFGLGFTKEEAAEISKELHSPIRHKFPRRKIIVNHIDEIQACDLWGFSKEPFYHKKIR